MKKILIILVIVLVLGAGTAFFLLRPKVEKDYSFNYDPGTYFVTDIQGSYRLLKTDVILAMNDSRKEDFYTENNHRIRNTVIFILRNMAEDELQKGTVQDSLNREIVARLNSEFETEDFNQVYFNEFVIQ